MYCRQKRPILVMGPVFLFSETFNQKIRRDGMKSKKEPASEPKKEGEVATEKKNQPSPSPESHGEPSGNEVETMKSPREHFPYLGTDSTAVVNYEIRSVEEDEEEEMEKVTAWLQRSKGAKVDTPTEINAGVELAKGMTAGYNKLINSTGKNLAEKAIALGKILIRLKNLARASGSIWGVWAEKNLDFISKRSRERCMLLAARTDCHKYAFLGQERLEVLCSATKESEEADPIRTLLAKYKIKYDEEAEVNLGEFRLQVDAAVNCERLEKNHLPLSFEKVKNLTTLGIDFDKSFLRRLKDIQESGGDPEKYLEKISMNRGAESAESEGGKSLSDFNTLSERLIKTLDYLLREEDQRDKIHTETLDKLWQKVMKLREAMKLQEPA